MHGKVRQIIWEKKRWQKFQFTYLVFTVHLCSYRITEVWTFWWSWLYVFSAKVGWLPSNKCYFSTKEASDLINCTWKIQTLPVKLYLVKNYQSFFALWDVNSIFRLWFLLILVKETCKSWYWYFNGKLIHICAFLVVLTSKIIQLFLK